MTQIFKVNAAGQVFDCMIVEDDENMTLDLFLKKGDQWVKEGDKAFEAPFKLRDIPKSWTIKDGETVNL